MIVDIRSEGIRRMEFQLGVEFSGAEMRRLAERRRRRDFNQAAGGGCGCDAGSVGSLPPHQLAPLQVEVAVGVLFRVEGFRLVLTGGGCSCGSRLLIRTQIRKTAVLALDQSAHEEPAPDAVLLLSGRFGYRIVAGCVAGAQPEGFIRIDAGGWNGHRFALALLALGPLPPHRSESAVGGGRRAALTLRRRFRHPASAGFFQEVEHFGGFSALLLGQRGVDLDILSHASGFRVPGSGFRLVGGVPAAHRMEEGGGAAVGIAAVLATVARLLQTGQNGHSGSSADHASGRKQSRKRLPGQQPPVQAPSAHHARIVLHPRKHQRLLQNKTHRSYQHRHQTGITGSSG